MATSCPLDNGLVTRTIIEVKGEPPKGGFLCSLTHSMMRAWTAARDTKPLMRKHLCSQPATKSGTVSEAFDLSNDERAVLHVVMPKVRTTPSKDPRFPDDETRQIAEELEKNGHKPLEEHEPVQHEDDEDEEDEGDEPETPKKPVKKAKPAKAPKKETDEETDEDDEEDEDETEDDETEDEEEEVKPRRQVLIPIARVKQNEKRLRAELEGKISELTTQVETLQKQVTGAGDGGEQAQAKQADKVKKLTDIATAIAEKHDSDPELVKEILASAAALNDAKVELPKELTDAVARLDAAQKKRDEEDAEKDETDEILGQYEEEFTETFSVKTDEGKTLVAQIKASGLTIEQFKERLQDLVLGEEGEKFAKLSLTEVFELKKSKLLPKKAKSADGGSGRTATGQSEASDTELLSAEEINAMSPQEFEQYSERMAKGTRPRIQRRGRPV